VSSPGGVSGIQHHYTKGMYSDASSRWDIYGGEGQRYPAAEFGGLYQTGQSAATRAHDFVQPPDRMFTQNEGTPRRDNFAQVDLIPPPDSVEMFDPSVGKKLTQEEIAAGESKPTHKLKFVSPWIIGLLVLFTYIAISFWTEGGKSFVVNKLHHGKELSWKWMLFYGAFFTLAVVLVLYAMEVPLVSVERLT